MINDEARLRVFALLSMQSALLGVPTPSLRSVSVGWKGGHIAATFTYDAPPDTDLLDVVGAAEAEVIADLYEGMSASFEVKHLPSGELCALPEGHVWVFIRRES